VSNRILGQFANRLNARIAAPEGATDSPVRHMPCRGKGRCARSRHRSADRTGAHGAGPASARAGDGANGRAPSLSHTSPAATKSSSTQAPPGSEATPMAVRACAPHRSPNTPSSRLEAPSMTAGWAPKSPVARTYPRRCTSASDVVHADRRVNRSDQVDRPVSCRGHRSTRLPRSQTIPN